MKKVKKILSVLLIVVCTVCFLSCTNLYQNILRKERTAVGRYRVVFDQSGGLGGPDFVTVSFGQKVPDLDEAAPVNGTANFDGYYDKPISGTRYYDEELKSIAVWDKASDSVLFAHWTVGNERKITFDANGGFGSMEAQIFYVDETKQLAPLSFTYDGREFVGWTDSQSSKEAKYADGAHFTASGNVTLYAVWAKTEFTQNDHDNANFKEFDIYTPKQLTSIAVLSLVPENTFENKTITLHRDIDFEGTDFNGISSGNKYEDVKYRGFKGTFDGNGYVIKNMLISNPDGMDVGFIGFADEGSVIKNLGIESSSTIKGRNNVGGIAGSSSGLIENCYNAATITGQTQVGGIVGTIYGGKVTLSYNIGKVMARSGGGIVGEVSTVSEARVGEVSGSYYLDQSVSVDPGAEKILGIQLGSTQFADQSNFTGWDFATVWEMKTFTDPADIVNSVKTRPVLRQK